VGFEVGELLGCFVCLGVGVEVGPGRRRRFRRLAKRRRGLSGRNYCRLFGGLVSWRQGWSRR
jgi:hypothetical protein